MPNFYRTILETCLSFHSNDVTEIDEFDCSSAPSSPLNFTLSTVPGSPTALCAAWSVPIPRNGIITGYTVYCNTSINQPYPEQVIGTNIATIRSAVNGTTLVVTFNTGLNPHTQYSCYVTANTSYGQSRPSALVTALTAQSGNYALSKRGNSMEYECDQIHYMLHCKLFSVPSSPQHLSLSPILDHPTELSANWSVPKPRNGIITGYTVYCNTSIKQPYPEQVIGSNIATIKSVVNGTTLAVTFNTGLSPYTQYSCYVTANSSTGEGNHSDVVTERTGEASEKHLIIREFVLDL